MKEIDIAFSELIQKRKWYEATGVDRRSAARDKRRFREGELSLERMRYYLIAAGYECVQSELWLRK